MERLKDEGQDILQPVFGKPEEASLVSKAAPVPKQEVSMVSATIKRIITAEEFAAHSGAEEPWFAVKGEGTFARREILQNAAEDRLVAVYDGTPFMKDHPGGGESIALVAGQDAVSLDDGSASAAAEIDSYLDRRFHVDSFASRKSYAGTVSGVFRHTALHRSHGDSF